MADKWHVLYQDTRPEVTQAGRLIQVKDIHYRVDLGPAAGHEDVITVPEDQYNADNVRALIEAKVDQNNAVASL